MVNKLIKATVTTFGLVAGGTALACGPNYPELDTISMSDPANQNSTTGATRGFSREKMACSTILRNRYIR